MEWYKNKFNISLASLYRDQHRWCNATCTVTENINQERWSLEKYYNFGKYQLICEHGNDYN